MPFRGEDKTIMVLRAQLEQRYTTQLTDEQRTAWLGHWLSDPPRDAHGRTYQVEQRTTLQQTTRPAATIYAWSQIFAGYRFSLEPVDAPIDVATPLVTVSLVQATPLAVSIRVSNYGETEPTPPLLWYAYRARPGETTASASRFKIATTLQGAGINEAFYITGALEALWPLIEGDTWFLRTYYTDANNQLKPLDEPLQFEVAAP